ncbi:MAG TPA: hypothetical protein VFN42_10275 [Acetobacteraceae bacterium]|nr:hypothetical protein [Acetobacteraceae bacterium]
MSPFIVRALPSDQLPAVYPLVREFAPSLEAASWLRFARQLVNGKRPGQGGIVGAWRLGRSFPCGLFCYRVDNDLMRGKILVAEHFVAVDLLDPQAVLSALVEELDSLAARLGCRAVRSVVHGGNDHVHSGLAAAGHEPEASLLLKPVLAHTPPARHATRRAALAHH